ncbi:Rne/Rng family ribonuclease [Cloacibacillus sp.]|uniref:Rne/Rng family ribonuclease n=1 Tax=Cloacibacillus sp. TaxID=2049023 RepID=UPI0025C2D3E9|nr:Rne/Rng family ribonuclease [Cloacibacillus sp.]MCC8056934.1 Rne/Rng family ribonuclease [Cloacibacillus sp.]MCC8178060.1 Rne/Rng family ribonuclease [Cloacibacillus sp.]
MSGWSKKIIANLVDPEEIRIAIIDEKGKLYEFFVERMLEHQRTGEIYKARVDSVLPGMNSAFLNLGDGRNGFLYLDDVKGMEVRPGMEMLMQVVKNARKGKGARVSPRVSLAGRYMVLIPGGHETGVSKRIEDDEERARLRAIAKDLRPQNFGIIIRTVAEGCDAEGLREDVEGLLSQWETIQRNAKQNGAPCLIHRDIGSLERVLRDELTDEIDEIVIDSEEEKESVEAIVKKFFPEKEIDVNLFKGKMPLFEVYGLENQIAELQDRKVWLPSGAYLVIDQTEALTVIDVNTGKFVGSKNLNDTVLKTNLEAAIEIARQLRLRALGGIVVVDFIDMENESDNQALVHQLQELFKNDRCKARVYGVTGLGLVEITRKRARTDIRAALTRGCPFCGGLGTVTKEESVAVQIKRFIRKITLSSKAEALLVECYTTVAEYISETFLSAWEEEFERKIFIRGCPDLSWGKYRLKCQGSLSQVEHRINVLQKREGWAIVHRSPSA